MRVLWKGSITFGLVTIPVSLYPATQREELKFRLLRSTDHSPVNYKRVAEADGKEVPWDQIVKGYEYEKGKFVILKEEDFARVDVEATQTVDIINFVSLADVDPLLFYKPYYLEVGKGGDKAYVLLRDALMDTGKIAIAKVVIRARQHLAAVKPQKKGLMLELMHFPRELVDVSEFDQPKEKTVGKAEMQMARQLITSMSTNWHPQEYTDEYHLALEKLIEDKIEHGDKAGPKPAKKHKATNVIDLVSVLQKSLQQTKGEAKGGKKRAAKKSRAHHATHKKAA
ncbi:Ku protein [Chthoniobacter flavus Ellin428]|uniref:Non-homologous end joining protein Ku n=1 Tax=Chthoniobacter flavus Ellin428 TaxID=497964 RepID=B4D5W9_9BACT|nr:Ku protein [Chthoniobacter flavus]EDY18172.1 Ku protein [Chthoniobacter flavus Ellin428]TCO91474.1 DNA end-binding protein Ku [Chthoniobacter flavus]